MYRDKKKNEIIAYQDDWIGTVLVRTGLSFTNFQAKY
jgi:hypothetical protein